jgi:hypothetical protein
VRDGGAREVVQPASEVRPLRRDQRESEPRRIITPNETAERNRGNMGRFVVRKRLRLLSSLDYMNRRIHLRVCRELCLIKALNMGARALKTKSYIFDAIRCALHLPLHVFLV